MDATIGLAQEKTRILSGLDNLLDSRRERLQAAIKRGDTRAADLNRRHLAAEESRYIELAACNDWDFWHRHRDSAADLLFVDLESR